MTGREKVIGIVGSYRKEGIVDSAVSEILRAAEQQGVETKKIYLLDQHIEFCTNCRTCMQEPGEMRGKCILDDDLDGLLTEIERADYLVIGAPVNFGNVNALTRKFLERCVGFAWWPWESHAPKIRKPTRNKRAILVSSSGAPAWMARYFTGTLGALKKMAALFGARPVGVLWVGLINKEQMNLPQKSGLKAHVLGRRLVAD